MRDTDINIDLARETIKDVLSDNMPTGVLIERIIAAVADFYGLLAEDLLSAKRKADVLLARQGSHLSYAGENTGISLKKIGDIFRRQRSCHHHQLGPPHRKRN